MWAGRASAWAGLALAICIPTAAHAAPDPATAAPAPAPVWRITGLDSPESVALAPDGRTLYVANVGGEGDVRDGNGYISRVSATGEVLDRQWITGLDAPKGAIVHGGRLYVSDIDRLVEIDVASGRVARRYPAAGATFLNDVAVAPDGTVLTADSGTGRIFGLGGGVLGVWAEGPDLRSVNGLLPERDRLLVTTMEGKLLSIAYATRAITVLATGLGQSDGVAAAPGGGYFVSEWPGRLFLVRPGQAHRTLIDSRASETYINDFIRVGDLLIAPNWKPGSLTAYRAAVLSAAAVPPWTSP